MQYRGYEIRANCTLKTEVEASVEEDGSVGGIEHYSDEEKIETPFEYIAHDGGMEQYAAPTLEELKQHIDNNLNESEV